MPYPVEIALTDFQAEVLYHRVQLLTDPGLIAELYDDRSSTTKKGLVDSATKYLLLLRPEKAVTIILLSLKDAEILSEALEGCTYFGNEKPNLGQRASINGLADILTPLVGRTVIPVFW